MKQTVLLLHGALGAASQLEPLAALLREHAKVESLNFAGHGGLPVDPGTFDMSYFAQQVQEAAMKLGGPVNVFGYSMGGYAALLAAATMPAYFASITTLGTKFDWSPAAAEAETRFLDPAKMEAKIPAFVEQLRQRHAPTPWTAVVAATARLMRDLGEAPLLRADNLTPLIELPVQVLVGDADHTAGAEASQVYAGYLPLGRFQVLENTPHPFERVDLPQLAALIRRFSA